MKKFPLYNKHIIVTNSPGKNRLSQELISRKARVIDFPMIEITENKLSGTEEETIKNLNNYDYISFTSKNGVHYFFNHLKKHNRTFPETLKAMVIGTSTGQELEKHGIQAEIINPGTNSEELLAYLKKYINLKGKKILLVQGNLSSDHLKANLSKIANISTITVYRTTKPETTNPKVYRLIMEGKYDLITFSSPSAFNNLLSSSPGRIEQGMLKAACIGKTTADSMREKGYIPQLVAQKPQPDIFADEIEHYFFNTKNHKN